MERSGGAIPCGAVFRGSSDGVSTLILIFASERNWQCSDGWRGKYHSGQHHRPRDEPGQNPVRQEFSCLPERKTGGRGGDATGQSRLNDTKDEVAIAAWGSQHSQPPETS